MGLNMLLGLVMVHLVSDIGLKMYPSKVLLRFSDETLVGPVLPYSLIRVPGSSLAKTPTWNYSLGSKVVF